jgi:endonuclease/exonuclease/phosphatase family metal-dependent hydrolase
MHGGLKSCGLLLLVTALSLAVPAPAMPQTTVVFNVAGTEAGDVAIRGGQYASVNYEGQILVTRASSTADYVRRILLKFDTANRIPANALIQSATLTLTVRGGNSATRQLSAYYLTQPFETTVTTWQRRQSSTNWTTAGGTLGAKYAEATVTGSPGSRVTFDLTRLVQDAVDGRLASSWTRVAILDPGGSTGDSYREFHPLEASDPAVRPTLTVVYGSTARGTSDGSTSGTATGTTSLTQSSTTGSTSSALPSGWSTGDVGSVAAAGSVVHSGGQYTVTGSGRDIWDTADGFRFVSRSLTGDGEIVARVESLQHVHDWTKGGVMMRESLHANSRQAFMLVSAGKGYAFQRRTATGGLSTHTSGGSGKAPRFVRLTRTGNTFRAYHSADGVSWTLVGSDTISMASTIHVGLAVVSKVDGTLATGTFTHVAVTAGTVEATTPVSSTTVGALRVLHWNIHHGVGTDGRYDIDRLATWMASFSPDIISLNEVEKNVSSWGNEDQPARFASLLRQKTGHTWYYHFAQRSGSWSSNGQGNLVLSRFPLTHTARLALSCNRSVALAGVVVNGRAVNVISTHLDDSSSSCRTTQTNELLAWFRNFPEQRIIAGDWNAQAGDSQVTTVTNTYIDAWAKAVADGTATCYDGNTRFGATRNTRIDYIFYSKQATSLALRSARVYDTRGSGGYMPSDHKPLLVTFEVR